MMLQKSMSSGARHGVELKKEKLNAANGNCLFQAIINNIENRPCYTNKPTESDKDLRIRCITKAQQEAHLIPCIKTDTTISEWNKLKQPGTYETELANTAIVAVARAIHKDILVFNTNNVISNSPI